MMTLDKISFNFSVLIAFKICKQSNVFALNVDIGEKNNGCDR